LHEELIKGKDSMEHNILSGFYNDFENRDSGFFTGFFPDNETL